MTGFPSIDQPWLKYYPCAWKPEMVPAKSVYRNILENNRDYPKDTALIYQGFKTSYEKLFEGVDAVAKALKAAGIGVGDCVNMIISYTPEAVCLLLACSKIGALANFINPFFTADQVVARIRDTESGLLIVLDAMFPYVAESAAEIPAEKIVIVPAVNSLPFAARQIANTKRGKNAALKQFCRTDRRYVSWKDFIGDGRTYTGETEESYAKDRPMVMVYSSGTTGASKGIVLTNDGINAHYAHYAYADFEFCRNDIFLAMIPIWFSTGNVMSLLTPLAHGLTIALEPEFKKENFAKDVLKYKPLMTVTATSLWRYLVTCPEYNGADLSFFRYPITGGEKVTEEIENEINRFLREHNCSMPLLKGYGMCELGGTLTATSPMHSKTGSVGYPLMGAVAAAFHVETDEELPYGERGEIRALSPMRMKGYYKNQAATDVFFHEDTQGRRWACTGDIGYVDEGGDVFICGRASDCYHDKNGHVAYCFDVEDVVSRHPAVFTCKLVEAMVEAKNAAVLHVVLKKDVAESPAAIISELAAACRKELPAEEMPEYYSLKNALPVHANGKCDVESLKKDIKELKHF